MAALGSALPSGRATVTKDKYASRSRVGLTGPHAPATRVGRPPVPQWTATAAGRRVGGRGAGRVGRRGGPGDADAATRGAGPPVGVQHGAHRADPSDRQTPGGTAAARRPR